jgi:glutathionylspermidine synthase
MYQAKWHINHCTEKFSLFTDDFVDDTSGDIGLCEDFLIFADSQSNICDNYFRRIE